MTAEEFARRIGHDITLRYFTAPPEDKHWRAALSKHTFRSVTVALADSDSQAMEEGWGESPDEACEELGKAMLASFARRQRGSLNAANEFGRRAVELEKLLTG